MGRGFSVIIGQVVGTMPAPAIYGAVVDAIRRSSSEEQAHRIALAASNLLPVASVILFSIGAVISGHYPDYKEKLSSNAHTEAPAEESA